MLMHNTSVCIVCGGALRFWVRKMNRDVYRCIACGHVTVPDGVARRPDGATIYESDDSIFEADGNSEYYLDDTNAAAARAKLAYVARYIEPGARLLDVGASYGHFLAEARAAYVACGVEVSRAAAEWGRTTFGVDVAVGSAYQLVASGFEQYAAITFWDVIEHLERPGLALDEIRGSLARRGLLFLSTPDAGSLVARAMGTRWHYLDPVQHINLFSRRNLIELLRAHGFELVDSRYFGRSYRVSYMLNRLLYLVRGSAAAQEPTRRTAPEWCGRLTIPIKLWDVMGLVARRLD
jgi:SAM-dependent methyltransferase